MNTLRAKITMLVVAATLTVIGLAVWAIMAALPYPPPPFERMVDINAYYLGVILNGGSPYRGVDDPTMPGASGKFGLKPAPADGEVWEGMTKQLSSALRERSISAPVVVSWTAENLWPVASIAVADKGWLVIPIFIPPPALEVLPFVLGGIFLIVAGTAIVAIGVTYRLMRPLALIRTSLAKVSLNGELPVLAEHGPADIKATARAINLLSLRLRRVMESRMRLVAAAGHDFRTPLTRMRLRAEFLDDTDRAKWLADVDELDHIADAAIRLVQEEIADSAGNAVRLDRLVSEVIAELQELRFDIRAMETEPVEVMGKPLSLKRAIRNLLINAATHGGGAAVSIRRNAMSALVEIVDSGPGIPEELLTRAFEPFFRVDPQPAPMAGTGLGLAIAKEIIHHNRGTLILANRASGGLIQTIQMPAASNGV